MVTGQRLPWEPARLMPETGDVYALIYTSGTSGTPKAATVTHRAAMHVAGCYRQLLGLSADDVTAICLPFSYVSGHISQLNPVPAHGRLRGGPARVRPGAAGAGAARAPGDGHRRGPRDVRPAAPAPRLRRPATARAAAGVFRRPAYGAHRPRRAARTANPAGTTQRVRADRDALPAHPPGRT